MNKNQTLPSTLWPFIWHYLQHKKACLAGFMAVGLIWAMEMSLSPYLLKIIIDTVVQFSNDPVKMLRVVLLPGVFYVSMTLVLNLNFRFYDYINLNLFPKLQASVDTDMFGYVLQHSSAFFQNTFAGNITKKIADMSENIELLIKIPSDLFIPQLFAICIACFTLMKVVHPVLGLILVIWAVLFICFSYWANKKTEKLSQQFSESQSKMTGTLSDSISNVTSIKLYDTTAYEISHVNREINHLVSHDRALRWYNLKVNFFQGLGITILSIAMFIALMRGIEQGWVSPGDFALVFTLLMSFIQAVYSTGNQIQQFSQIMGTCKQALTIIEIPHEIIDSTDAYPLVIKQGAIKFEQVLFHYENAKPIFKHLTIQINPGEKIGLVGYSGGGKSTFIKLILRLIDTQEGNIFIDEQDIKQVTQSSLRMQIGTIQQEPELFHRTIMENIRFAKAGASDDEVIEAAKKARCHEFIVELPEQYQSIVGERGVKLSGGQKQRVAIARAFLKNAPILLLDEATSSLDSVTESYIQEALHQVMFNRTTIAIAHRLSTLKDMDRILVFEHGQIIEDGPLESLLENTTGRFYQLWQMQATGFIAGK
ncbi:MAG: ABC transporter ATP-binding protein [Legionellaceae bacterium]|nr:ABC transporter ATP-binding protein [Legionellaceae bacterium]